MAPTVIRLPTMQETQVLSLRWEDTLEKEMATHSSILAWKIPWTEIWLATVHAVAKSRTRLSNFTRLVIAFLLRSKHLLISWLQSPSTVILETPPKYSLSLFPCFRGFRSHFVFLCLPQLILKLCFAERQF